MWKTNRNSITRQLIVTLTGLAVGLWLISSLLAVLIMHHELDQSLDSALEEAAQRLLTLAVASVRRDATGTVPAAVEPSVIAPHTEYLTYQLRNRDGELLLKSHERTVEPHEAPLARGFHDTETLRIYTEPSADGMFFLQVAETHAHRHEAVLEAGLALILPLSLVIPLGAFAIARIVGHCLEPLRSLQREISERGGGNLDPLTQMPKAEELQPVAIAVDRLLDRLKSALNAERAFAASSAHELRTPLASALARLQRVSGEFDDPAVKERLLPVEADLKRLGRLSEKLLQLSRADAGVSLSEEESELRPVLDLVIDDLQRSNAYRGRIRVEAGRTASLTSRMEMDAFGIVMRNLIENALVHGAAEAPVVVDLGPGRSVRVRNAGPAVPPGDLARLTDRFHRGAKSSGGAGLGLAIVKTIVERSGGRLEIASPAPGREDGFEVTIDLP